MSLWRARTLPNDAVSARCHQCGMNNPDTLIWLKFCRIIPLVHAAPFWCNVSFCFLPSGLQKMFLLFIWVVGQLFRWAGGDGDSLTWESVSVIPVLLTVMMPLSNLCKIKNAEMKGPKMKHLWLLISGIKLFFVVDVLIWHYTNIHYYIIHFD